MLTLNATLFFAGVLFLGGMLALFLEQDGYVKKQIREGERYIRKNDETGIGISMLFFFFLGALLVFVTCDANGLVFALLIVLDVVFIGIILCFWCTRVFDQGYTKLFSHYLCSTLIMCMVIVYSLCISGDLNNENHIKLSEDYQVETVSYCEYVALQDKGIMIYEGNNGKKFAKIIPWNEVSCEVAELGIEQADTHVYREKRVYQKMDYSFNPPEKLEETEVVWSEYILCAPEDLVKQVIEKKWKVIY